MRNKEMIARKYNVTGSLAESHYKRFINADSSHFLLLFTF